MGKVLCGVLLCWCTLFTTSAFAENDSLSAFSIQNSLTVINGVNELAPPTEEENLDSLTSKLKQLMQKPAIRPRSFIMPASLAVTGAIMTFHEKANDVNDFAKKTMYKDGNENHFKADHYIILAPAAAVYALNIAGIKGQHNLGDRTAILTLASVICNGVVFSTKRLTGIQRPDESDFMSFPSGHTAQTFASAEFLRQEYRNVSPWYGAAGYAVAVTAGVLRMYHNKHWLGDVVAGAGVGILSTRLSYWLYPKIKRSLAPNTNKNVPMIAPSYSNGAFGLSLVHNF